jgi:hypothetical protein
MYKTHLSYINSNIYSLYKDYTFSSEYDVDNVDNSAYYGETVYKFMRDHIGYRFVLRDSQLSTQVSQGGTLNLDFNVENTGFANPIRSQKAELILEKDGEYITTEVDLNSTEWYSCTTTESQLALKIPNLETGDWNVYLRLSVGNNSLSESYLRCVKFANYDIWNTSLGANYLGTFEVVQSSSVEDSTNNTFYQINTENPVVSNGDIYTYNGMVILDGQLSSTSEWSEDSKMVEDGDNELYVSNDDSYLYVMAKIVQDASSPVYNLRIVNQTNGETYWLYYQSNGYVYFNHNGGNADGIVYKHVGDYVEFKVPFGDIMGLDDGVVLTSIEVNVQSSSEAGWPSVGRLKSGEYTIDSSFAVYSTSREVTLNEGDNFPMSVETSLTDAQYQWYLDGTAIQGATQQVYTLEDATSNDIGTYSVKVTSSSGLERVVDICTVKGVVSGDVIEVDSTGDVNLDGSIDTIDVLLLKRYLLSYSVESLPNPDVNADGSTNLLDLLTLKEKLFKL